MAKGKFENPVITEFATSPSASIASSHHRQNSNDTHSPDTSSSETEHSPMIYLIRHGEKPPKNPNGSDADGLSALGIQRSQGLVQVFGRASEFNIGYIVAEKPKKDGSRNRPLETITPLADSLSLVPNATIDRDDAAGAAEACKAYVGSGNVLLCWEHGVLAKIVKELGVRKDVEYPSDRFDLIWAVSKPYREMEWVGSEGVEGLDEKFKGEWVSGGFLPEKAGDFEKDGANASVVKAGESEGSGDEPAHEV